MVILEKLRDLGSLLLYRLWDRERSVRVPAGAGWGFGRRVHK